MNFQSKINVKAVVAAFNQEKALVGAFSVIVQPVVEPMEHYTALHAGGLQLQEETLQAGEEGAQEAGEERESEGWQT